MNAHLSIVHLILMADPLVKGVLFILLLASILSWALIFQRHRLLKQEESHLVQFEKQFWSGVKLPDLYRKIDKKDADVTGIAHLFYAGYRELNRLEKLPKFLPEAIVAGVERLMKVALMRESDRLQSGLSLLATIGSVSPYVGLFGTVWGIMSSFQALGGVQQATLSMVAPGISEALIATAMGLFVAIPAVVSYNRFVARSERLLNAYENFQDEFLAIVHREVYDAGEKS